MYYVYLLRCKDKSLYCGQTHNLEKRIHEHNFSKSKSSKYVRGRTPVRLVYFETVKTLSNALKREYEIKNMQKSQKEHLVLAAEKVKKLKPSKGKKE